MLSGQGGWNIFSNKKWIFFTEKVFFLHMFPICVLLADWKRRPGLVLELCRGYHMLSLKSLNCKGRRPNTRLAPDFDPVNSELWVNRVLERCMRMRPRCLSLQFSHFTFLQRGHSVLEGKYTLCDAFSLDQTVAEPYVPVGTGTNQSHFLLF